MSEHGTFHWNELMTGDTAAAKAFFESTVGWTFDSFDMPMGGTYLVAMQDGKPVGGLMDSSDTPAKGSPPHWVCYLSVDDVDARIAGVAAAGGTVLQPPFDVPQVGRIAMVADPTGAVMGWITPAPM